MLSEEEVIEFQKIWKQEFNEDIDLTMAAQKANYVFEFYKTVYLPIDPEELTNKYENETRNTN